MSILINLLPDLRQAKLRDKRRRQLMSGISVLVWMVCGGLIVVLTLVVTGQKVAENVLTKNIADKTKQLQAITGLPDALTAEEHLKALPALYAKRVYLTRFFQAYSEANPTDITLGSLSIDASNEMKISGTAKTFAGVAKLDRALEASNVKVGKAAAASNLPYFTNVTISNVDNSSRGVTFTIHATLATGVSAADCSQTPTTTCAPSTSNGGSDKSGTDSTGTDSTGTDGTESNNGQ